MPRPRPAQVALVLGVYVVPLTAVVVFLLTKGLPVLAFGLLTIELAVVAAVLVAKRWPAE